MKKWVRARLFWLPENLGGRKAIIGSRVMYCPIIEIAGVKATGSAWSAEIYTEKVIRKNETQVRLSFLVPNAPFYLLEPEKKFELFEGARKVACGLVEEIIVI